MTFLFFLTDPANRWYYALRGIFILLLGLLIYGQTFNYGFIFDDLDFIVNNPCIKGFDHVHYIWKTYPLTRTLGFYSFALNYFIGQLHPQGYHIFNFIIHLVATALVWAISSLILRLTGWFSTGDILRQETPFIIAVLFLVHPCQIQAITYISQRFESLASVFYLASIYSYISARIASSTGRKSLMFMFSAGFAILGILTKEIAVTIPLMILALEYFIFNENYMKVIKAGRENLKRISAKALLLVLMAGAGFFILFEKLVGSDLNIFFHFNPIPSQSHDGEMITAKGYLLTQMRVFLTLIRLLILPIHQNLDYDYPLSKGIFDPPLTLAGIFLILVLLFSIFNFRKKYPLISFGLAWILVMFSVNLAPRANVIFEHKLYLISFGFFLVLVNVLFILIPNKRYLIFTFATIVAALSLLSFQRNEVWKNGVSLWSDVVKRSPHKARPYDNLGLSYNESGDYAKAIKSLDMAIKIRPDYIIAYYNRAISYKGLSNFDKAISDYDMVIKLDPVSAGAYFDRASTYSKKGDFAHALLDYNKSIELNKDYIEAYINRGVIYAQEGQTVKAMLDLGKAIEKGSKDPEVYVDRGILYAQKHDFEHAMSDFSKAIEINPYFAKGYNNRAFLYYQLKQNDNAWQDIQKAEVLGFPVNPAFINDVKRSFIGLSR